MQAQFNEEIKRKGSENFFSFFLLQTACCRKHPLILIIKSAYEA
jgi:hypothetical protein